MTTVGKTHAVKYTKEATLYTIKKLLEIEWVLAK